MKKGIVMNIDKKWAYIFSEGCMLVKVKLQPHMAVGKEIFMNAQTNTISRRDPQTTHSSKFLKLRPAMVALGLVVLLAIGAIIGQTLLTPSVYATVALDINPSVEFSLNKNLDVIQVKAMNQEALQLLTGIDLENINWKEAILRWTKHVREMRAEQIQNMLISAVMPENATELKTQLMEMDGIQNQGELNNIQVSVIYSNDEGMAKQASENGLSIGRQMLLNQAREQNQDWDETTIKDAPLGELVRNLLRQGEANQTGLTKRANQNSDVSEISDESDVSDVAKSQGTPPYSGNQYASEKPGNVSSGAHASANQPTTIPGGPSENSNAPISQSGGQQSAGQQSAGQQSGNVSSGAHISTNQPTTIPGGPSDSGNTPNSQPGR